MDKVVDKHFKYLDNNNNILSNQTAITYAPEYKLEFWAWKDCSKNVKSTYLTVTKCSKTDGIMKLFCVGALKQ